jgi:hypothetical protein
MRTKSDSTIRVQFRYQPDLQRQALALLRLLGHVEPGQKREPQDWNPGAEHSPAAGANGRAITGDNCRDSITVPPTTQ